MPRGKDSGIRGFLMPARMPVIRFFSLDPLTSDRLVWRSFRLHSTLLRRTHVFIWIGDPLAICIGLHFRSSSSRFDRFRPVSFHFFLREIEDGEGGGAGDDRERVGDLATMMNREGSIIGVRGRSAAEKLASAGRAEKPQRNLRLGKTEGVAADG